MNTKKISLKKLKENPDNPRRISDTKFSRLIGSILTLPKMLEEYRPIVIDKDNIILGGNMRFKALQAIAKMSAEELHQKLSEQKDFGKKTEDEQSTIIQYWEQFLQKPEVAVINAESLTDDERSQFIIADNGDFGTWDYDMLANQWDAEDLANWGVDVWQDKDMDIDSFFDENSNADNVKEEDDNIHLAVTIPSEYADDVETIKTLIKDAVIEYKGIKIK